MDPPWYRKSDDRRLHLTEANSRGDLCREGCRLFLIPPEIYSRWADYISRGIKKRRQSAQQTASRRFAAAKCIGRSSNIRDHGRPITWQTQFGYWYQQQHCSRPASILWNYNLVYETKKASVQRPIMLPHYFLIHWNSIFPGVSHLSSRVWTRSLWYREKKENSGPQSLLGSALRWLP